MSDMTALPTVDDLRAALIYEPETGRLIWKARDRNLTGLEAGGVDPRHGYRRVRIGRKLHLAHRIIMAMTNGAWPDGEVDHINRNRSDNRLCNLRLVSRTENVQNKPIYRTNKSGTAGVYWHGQSRKWCAAIQAGGKRTTLGVFKNIADAIAARKAAEIDLGFHPNHGKDTA